MGEKKLQIILEGDGEKLPTSALATAGAVKPKRTRLSGEAKLLRDAHAQLERARKAQDEADAEAAKAKANVEKLTRIIDALAADTEQGQPHVTEAA
jgi:hypothetical protein